jgi:hypothetical protein
MESGVCPLIYSTFCSTFVLPVICVSHPSSFTLHPSSAGLEANEKRGEGGAGGAGRIIHPELSTDVLIDDR